ncbi:phytoene/squalene synthase family protein [Halorhodospira halophila]|uniref:Squalene/phytoene synthase n=1 Tax=Halorhodospira halophila (strain DSM 244 / SL1) TaxID=349124 RepID=A1WUK1_HALHL|nr:squalene/phytoene synthase family protein [Halorhodospira halophila]ABM61363.1 squalene/phytoene synthase [Halorhodospira halophila SL1]MBK1729054.1 hypothetical protein [Halorhodospira halophila]
MSPSHIPPETLARAAPPGSSLDYALRLAPAHQREPLQAIAAFTGEIRRIPWHTQEAEVGRATLHWWRTELARILEGGGQHPLAAPLAAAVHEHQLPGAELRAILDEADRALDGDRPETFPEQLRLAERHAAAPLRLAAQVLVGDASATGYATALGSAVGLTRSLRLQGLAARYGDSDLPRETLRQAGVPAEGPLLQSDGTALPSLLRALAVQADAIAPLFPAARGQAPEDRRRVAALRPVTAYAALHQALIAEILRRGPAELIRGRLTLTPLRKVWVAWRGQP